MGGSVGHIEATMDAGELSGMMPVMNEQSAIAQNDIMLISNSSFRNILQLCCH
jgi:hypothetical protein